PNALGESRGELTQDGRWEENHHLNHQKGILLDWKSNTKSCYIMEKAPPWSVLWCVLLRTQQSVQHSDMKTQGLECAVTPSYYRRSYASYFYVGSSNRSYVYYLATSAVTSTAS